jgi:hypothetical protein
MLLGEVHGASYPVKIPNCAPHLHRGLFAASPCLVESALHYRNLPIDQDELSTSDACVCDCGEHYEGGAHNISLSVSAAQFESLPPTALQWSLLILAGTVSMGIGGFAGLCIFIFKGSRRDGLVAALLLIVGSIQFLYGVG